MVNRRLTEKDVKTDIWLRFQIQLESLIKAYQKLQKEGVYEKERKK